MTGNELHTERLFLRRWRDSDRAPFAAINADPEVTEFLAGPLTRSESDKLAQRICEHFDVHGFGLWAVEIPGEIDFIGFIGLSIPTFEAHFTPCVEVGWRLARDTWGKGYATEGARAAIDFGFNDLHLEEIVSFTTVTNRRSRAVMERLGMRRDPADDFDHPGLPPDHPLHRHVLYRIGKGATSSTVPRRSNPKASR